VFRTIEAGALYAIIVFLIGFILGTIRVLLLVPGLGETTGVIVEAPIVLAASWFVCRWCVDRLKVRRTVPAGSSIGSVAFVMLMSAEVGRGAVFGRSIANQLAAYGSLAGAIGLAGSGDLCYLPGHSGLAVRQALRAAKYRRSLDRHFFVCQTGKKLPGNKEKEKRKTKMKKEKVCLGSRFAQYLRSWNLNRTPDLRPQVVEQPSPASW